MKEKLGITDHWPLFETRDHYNVKYKSATLLAKHENKYWGKNSAFLIPKSNPFKTWRPLWMSNINIKNFYLNITINN